MSSYFDEVPGSIEIKDAIKLLEQNKKDVDYLSVKSQTFDKETSNFCMALQRNTTVQTIDMSFVGLGDVALTQIALAIKKQARVTTLLLNGNAFTCAPVAFLVQAPCVIKSLNLSQCKLAKSFGAISNVLLSNKSIAELDLSSCELDDTAIAAIATVLSHNATLRTLNISENPFGKTGALRLAEALSLNDTIRSLQMRNPVLGVVGLGAIIESVKQHKSLRHLYIGYVKQQNANSFIEMLTVNKTLRGVRFAFGREVTGDRITKTWSVLIQHFHLQELEIKHSPGNISLEEDLCIRQFLENNDVLTRLTLKNFHYRDQEAIATSLERNRVLISVDISGTHMGPIAIVEARVGSRNFTSRWFRIYELVLDIAIALLPLDLPLYVVLWICNWLPDVESIREIKKVRLLEKIYATKRRLRGIVDE